MNAQQSAYNKGFDAGLNGAGIDATPYRGHTTGFHRGLANEWRRGCENGECAATMRKSAPVKRDFAENESILGDNAHAAGNWAGAAEHWLKAAQHLRAASDDAKYYANLTATKTNRHQ